MSGRVEKVVPLRTPLWPAGHLPLKGGERLSGRSEGGISANLRRQRAYRAAASVVDPEIPAVTIEDLGILRGVEMEGDVAVARVTPTYTGCPAVLAIELAVEAALREAGFEPRVERVIAPAWTTDWISEEGREKLRAYGIAPPAKASNSIRALFGETEVTCPRCGSPETARVSEFGSTACKALYRCESCHEPFDYFKCI
ncbi:phenylacetic acid degradation protein [Nitratireductor pacificus pht-3B]|uniref:Phenylacetic acid degradation protein n=1 Tax=Nitratireductor pacificus pht-3B TaxID=391937 RepID=K2MTQ1_9HYPH|nr:phenylacetic acid degradation protein [Nitratireductor pacificus pht-3B]